MDGFSQGCRHGSQLVPDLLGGHILKERANWRVLFGRVVQVRSKAQSSGGVINTDLKEKK